jgi:hypothetical protein
MCCEDYLSRVVSSSFISAPPPPCHPPIRTASYRFRFTLLAMCAAPPIVTQQVPRSGPVIGGTVFTLTGFIPLAFTYVTQGIS